MLETCFFAYRMHNSNMVSNTSSNYLTVCMHIVKLIMLE